MVRWPIASKTGWDPRPGFLRAGLEDDQRALFRWLAGAQDGRVDETDAMGVRDFLAAPGGAFADCRHLQPDRMLLRVPLHRGNGLFDNGDDRVRVGQHRDHDARAAGSHRGRARDNHAVVGQRFCLVLRPVPGGDSEPGPGHVPCHGETHGPARAGHRYGL